MLEQANIIFCIGLGLVVGALVGPVVFIIGFKAGAHIGTIRGAMRQDKNDEIPDTTIVELGSRKAGESAYDKLFKDKK